MTRSEDCIVFEVPAHYNEYGVEGPKPQEVFHGTEEACKSYVDNRHNNPYLNGYEGQFSSKVAPTFEVRCARGTSYRQTDPL